MFCTGCGAKMPDGTSFCTQCGKKMVVPTGGILPEQESTPKVESESIVKPEQGPVLASTPNISSESKTSFQKKNNINDAINNILIKLKENKKLLLIPAGMVLAAIAVMIICILASIIFSGDNIAKKFPHGIKIGQEYKTVKSKINEKYIDKSDKGELITTEDENFYGLKADISYYFERGDFVGVIVYVDNDDNDEEKIEKVVKKIENQLSKAYGKPEKSSGAYKTRVYEGEIGKTDVRAELIYSKEFEDFTLTIGED